MVEVDSRGIKRLKKNGEATDGIRTKHCFRSGMACKGPSKSVAPV